MKIKKTVITIMTFLVIFFILIFLKDNLIKNYKKVIINNSWAKNIWINNSNSLISWNINNMTIKASKQNIFTKINKECNNIDKNLNKIKKITKNALNNSSE